MEMALKLQQPLGCKEATMGSSHFRIRTTVGIFSDSIENKGVTRIRAIPLMRASSDYPRRRPRRSAIPKTKVSSPKGFAPRPQVGTSTRKKDHDPEEKEQSDSSNRNFPSTSQSSELRSDRIEESSTFGSISTISSNTVKNITEVLESEESGQDDDTELEDELSRDGGDEIIGTVMQEETIDYDDKDFEKRMGDVSSSGNPGLGATNVEVQIEKLAITENHTSAVHSKEELASVEYDLSLGQHDAHYRFHGESFSKIMTEMDAQTHMRLLEDLACENFSRGNKLFVFPKIIKSDEIVEVFFNRSLSDLSNEPDVLMKGAFNDWRWKSFTEKMHKSNLQQDWWSCKIYVPKEAYKMDFVFFNGAQIYENNNQKDFSLPIEGEMDESLFEDFLLEEEQKKLEKIAFEQEENKKQAEEQHRREVERAAMEADRAQAKLEVEKKREACERVMELADKSVDGLWHIELSSFEGSNRVRLYYNRSSCPLEHSLNIWIHGGYNNWIEGLSIVERLKKYEKRNGDWWYADVVVPDNALVLDWVFADGPPQQAKVYDNNNYQDFHAIITEGLSEEVYWTEEEQRVFGKLQEERRLKEEAARKKAEKTARLKAETKERTLKRFLLSQKHVVYTIPLDIHAGNLVKVLYNPSNTVLNGKQEVWFRCSFNRWTHRNGPLPPQKMAPAGNGTHLQANVKVPLDAYTINFVFSEREDGGVYDNKNGMDYNIPVIGGVVKEPPMHITHIAVEMAPIAKVGGLGDVVTSLSRAVQDLGHNVDIILPKYDCLKLNHVKDFCHHRSFCWGGTEIKVWHGRVEGLSVYFLEPQNGIFWAGCVYGRNNDGDRFGFFCHAALEFLLQTGFRPDILHCHDWSSAPVAWLFKELYKHNELGNARVIFTIHNLEFGIHQIGKAMTYADRVTTVSKTYSKEVSGNPAISPHLYKFHGILNGIDLDIWDPYNDNFIPVNYTSENVVEGKKAAKEALQQRLGLKKSDHPLVGVITRLTVQKGIHLIKQAISQTLDLNGQVVLLGSAPDPRIQNDFVNLSNQLHSSHGDRVQLCLTYDEPLSHLIYAGADFILVPSIFEPCGLTQLVAMRYGSIPVVRKTGGLYDTVFDVDGDKERAQLLGLEPNGFSFEGADSSGLNYALNRAISVWYDDRERFNLLSKRVMEQDWSWNRPALDYIELYHAARK